MKSSSRIIIGVVLLLSMVVGSVFILGMNNQPNEPNQPINPKSDIPFLDIDYGFYCGVDARRNYTICDNQSWQNLWNDIYSTHYPVPELPEVNFSIDLIFVVFQGVRSTGGYVTNITQIDLTEDEYIVYVDELHPGPSCGVTEALTQPYHIVKISGYPLDLPAQFVYNITTYECE
jgi:hypothetical protein